MTLPKSTEPWRGYAHQFGKGYPLPMIPRLLKRLRYERQSV